LSGFVSACAAAVWTSGATAIEYGLIAAGIAVAIVTAVSYLFQPILA
jgi:Flp pilus assembly pilin Flp